MIGRSVCLLRCEIVASRVHSHANAGLANGRGLAVQDPDLMLRSVSILAVEAPQESMADGGTDQALWRVRSPAWMGEGAA